MRKPPEGMKIAALAPWYGGNRTLAWTVGHQLGPLRWCGIPCAGGCPEIPWIDAAAGVACDVHRHVINLARVVRDDALCGSLIERLQAVLVHPDELEAAQAACRRQEEELGSAGLFGGGARPLDIYPRLDWAVHYFVACWMTRGGLAGQRGEFTTAMATRYSPGGGSSARRFRSAVESLQAWNASLRMWEFDRRDIFDFLERGYDEAGIGYYVDAPWPDDGDRYRAPFDYGKQERLAARLAGFKNARVVVRFGDHPLIRRLYPEGDPWTWVRQETRDQAGGAVSEVLIINGPAKPAVEAS